MKKIECFVILATTVMALLAVAPSGARNTGNASVATVVALRSVGLINDQMLAARRADPAPPLPAALAVEGSLLVQAAHWRIFERVGLWIFAGGASDWLSDDLK